MATPTPHLNLITWDSNDPFDPEDLNNNWNAIDAKFNPANGDAIGVVPGDINGLSSAQIDALFATTPPNGTVKVALSNTSILIIARINNVWYKTAALSAV
jgi:2-phospho-L-lactate guanylyltransferase (CobY/MobA/RfbA family)